MYNLHVKYKKILCLKTITSSLSIKTELTYMKIISGGVTAPKGFKAVGVSCGIKRTTKRSCHYMF